MLAVAAREGAHSYDAPGAEYTHRDGKCSFEVLVEDFGLRGTPGSFGWPRSCTPPTCPRTSTPPRRARGLSAIAHGFSILHGAEDHRKLELESPMYDALYAWCQRQVA